MVSYATVSAIQPIGQNRLVENCIRIRVKYMTPAHNLVVSVAEQITLPDVYHQISDMVISPGTKIDDFVDVVNFDNALAERIIRIANSHFFGYSRKAHTVKQAISLIGVMELKDLLLSSLAIRAFSGFPVDVINQELFWRSCIYCGITARLLAKKCMLPASGGLFTAGLLHEIGHIVMYTKTPELAQDVMCESEQNNQPLFIVEREKLGYDYGQVSSEIMRLWHLSDSYCDIAIYHMEPEKAQKNKFENQIVNLARSLMLAEELNPEQAVDPFLNKSTDLIKDILTVQDVETIKTNARLYVDDVIDCLWPFSRKVAPEWEIAL
ncbi:MAG: HDOD domain-containing protein [Methylococcaceae bacterium]